MAQEAELVRELSVLRDVGIVADALDGHQLAGRAPAGWREAAVLASMGTTEGEALHQAVPLGDLVL